MRAVAGTGAGTAGAALGGGHPMAAMALAPFLVASSPRLMGEAVHAAGRVAGIPGALKQAALGTRLGANVNSMAGKTIPDNAMSRFVASISPQVLVRLLQTQNANAQP